MMHVGRDCLFFVGSYYSVTFSFWHDIYPEFTTYVARQLSFFECKRTDSVLYNVILITRGTIFFTPQNAQLLARCHLIDISKVACWGRECA